MQRVSKIARDYLKEESEKDNIDWDSLFHGDFMYLDEIYEKAGLNIRNSIPPLRHQAVLNALERDSKKEDAIFIKRYFRFHDGGRLVRIFTLKDK